MANFPLVLAIEPSLLPYARANGFTMDHKVGQLSPACDSEFTCLSVSQLRLPEDV